MLSAANHTVPRHALACTRTGRKERGYRARSRRFPVNCIASETERAVVILPGLGNAGRDYDALAKSLSSRGVHVETAAVSRADWLRNGLGLRYPSYWQGTLEPRPTVDWYLNKVDMAVDAAKRATDGAPITILAHSAGGWMGRVYMLDFGTTGIDKFVSLGSPHNPPPTNIPGVIDQTRGILTWVEANCPGTHHGDTVEYTSVIGKYILGAPFRGGPVGTKLNQRIVGAGYQQVCGVADVWGDGIVPLPAGLLEGSKQLVLEGVYHSPIGAAVDSADMAEGARLWYGSEAVLDRWLPSALGEVPEVVA